MRADRVRFDPRTGNVVAEGAVEAKLGGRRLRAGRLRYVAHLERVEIENLSIEGALLPVREGASWRDVLAAARGRGQGCVATTSMPVPRVPPAARLGAPWLEAEVAEARDGLPAIHGSQGVRLGAGDLAIDGEAFDLDPALRLLVVRDPVVRLRDPLVQLSAAELHAKEDERAGLAVELARRVRGRVDLALGPRGEAVRIEVQAERLRVVPRRGGRAALRIEGAPVRVTVPGRCALEAPAVRGRLGRRRLSIEAVAGRLVGRLELAASAFAPRGSPRRVWTVVSARRIVFAPPGGSCSLLGGGELSRLPERILVDDAVLEGGERVRRLELFRPTWPRS